MSGEWCCDELDCERLESDQIREVDGGFLVSGASFVDGSRALPSPDGHFWACFSTDIDPEKGRVRIGIRCFFAPMNA